MADIRVRVPDARAWLGQAWPVAARPGAASLGDAGRGLAWRGDAGHRKARDLEGRMVSGRVRLPAARAWLAPTGLGDAPLGESWPGVARQGTIRKGKAMRNNFEPIGPQARWKTVYEILVKTPTGDIITYEQLAEALGLDPEGDRMAIRSAVYRAAKEHEEHDKRAVDAVHGLGYRPVDPRGSLELARGQQKKAGRSLVRGQSKAVNVDLNGVDPEVRKALELVGKAITMQLDFNRRFEGKQARLEEALREIADSQAEDRKRTDEEIAELRERLARLEDR